MTIQLKITNFKKVGLIDDFIMDKRNKADGN